MVWEHRLSIMVLLLEPEECPPFWPDRTSQHPLVVEGSWVDNALTVQSAGRAGEEGTADIPGVVMRRFTLSSAIENETQLLTIFQYTSWPQSGERGKRKGRGEWREGGRRGVDGEEWGRKGRVREEGRKGRW